MQKKNASHIVLVTAWIAVVWECFSRPKYSVTPNLPALSPLCLSPNLEGQYHGRFWQECLSDVRNHRPDVHSAYVPSSR
jgi:hypothetical protein